MPPENAPEGAEAPQEGAAPATPEPTTPTPAGPPPDFDRIYERMDEMTAHQQQLAEQLGQVFAEPEAEPEYYDDTGELTEDGVRGVVDDYVREQLETRLAERERNELIGQRDDWWEDLKERTPEFKDPKYVQEVLAEAMDLVANNQDLIDRPEFVDIVERVHGWRQRAAAQTPAQEGRGVVLESAQGAAQQTQNSNEPDWGARIVAAAEKLRPQI